MEYLNFSWDRNKNLTNIKKHKLSFEDAKSAFYDDNAKLISDPDNSDSEDRFILLGLSSDLKLLVVIHVYRDNENVIRIISARKATKTEQKYY